MTRIFFTLLLVQFVTITSMLAQAKIYMRDGQQLEASVQRLDASEVAFVPNGTRETVSTQPCNIEKIEFLSGRVERFEPCAKDNKNPKIDADLTFWGVNYKADGQPISNDAAYEIFKRTNKDATRLYQSGRSKSAFSQFLGLGGAVCMVTSLFYDDDSKTGTNLFIGSAIALSTGVAVSYLSYSDKVKAADRYTDQQVLGFKPPYQAPSYSVDFGLTQNGIGFAVKF
jgi:hypothetical protein